MGSGSLPMAKSGQEIDQWVVQMGLVQALVQAVLYDGDPRAGVRVGVFFP